MAKSYTYQEKVGQIYLRVREHITTIHDSIKIDDKEQVVQALEALVVYYKEPKPWEPEWKQKYGEVDQ